MNKWQRTAGTWKIGRMTRILAGDKIVAHVVAVDPPPYVGHTNFGDESKANAELIIRAVNAHDDLVGALKAVARWLETSDQAMDARGSADIDRRVHKALDLVEGDTP